MALSHCDLSGCVVVVVVVCRGVHDPEFKRALEIKYPKGSDPDVRFAMYDVDQDDRVTEDELVGEAVIRVSAFAGKGAVTLPLTKGGQAVTDAFIILNPTADSVKKARGPVEFSVTVGCRNFPILSGNDAVIAASARNPSTFEMQVVGQTERIP